MAEILKGAPVTAALNEKMTAEVVELKAKGVVPTLAIFRMGERDDDLSYERGAMNFRNLIEEHNANPGKDFRISIAHGFAQYNAEQQGKRLMTIMQQADLAMYENKKKIKESQKPPHEYYQTSVLCAEELL